MSVKTPTPEDFLANFPPDIQTLANDHGKGMIGNTI